VSRSVLGAERLTLGLAALLAATLVLVTGCRGGAMTPFRFEKDTESLQSLATDGVLLADGVVDGRTTSAFVRTHAQELASDADKLASVVASTDPEPQLAGKTKTLAALARKVASQLHALADHPGDRGGAATLRSGLANAADDASKLEEGV
jgi:hypoxanthine phosphoribosyltransferase